MTFEDQTDFASQVADLNKYGQALNRCETVEEVVSLHSGGDVTPVRHRPLDLRRGQ